MSNVFYSVIQCVHTSQRKLWYSCFGKLYSLYLWIENVDRWLNKPITDWESLPKNYGLLKPISKLENATNQEVKNSLKIRIVVRKWGSLSTLMNWVHRCMKWASALTCYVLWNSFELKYEIVIVKTSPYYESFNVRKQIKGVFRSKIHWIARRKWYRFPTVVLDLYKK